MMSLVASSETSVTTKKCSRSATWPATLHNNPNPSVFNFVGVCLYPFSDRNVSLHLLHLLFCIKIVNVMRPVFILSGFITANIPWRGHISMSGVASGSNPLRTFKTLRPDTPTCKSSARNVIIMRYFTTSFCRNPCRPSPTGDFSKLWNC